MYGPIALPDSASVAAALITLDNHLNARFFLPYPLPVLVEGGIFFLRLRATPIARLGHARSVNIIP